MMFKKVLKILKVMLFISLTLIGLLTITVIVFVNTAPQIGQKPEGADLARIKESPNYQNNEFVNLITTKMGSFGDIVSTLPDFIYTKNGSPSDPLPVHFGEHNQNTVDSLCFVTWYGHSAFLFEIGSIRILLDPMLGEASSPVSFGSRRFPYSRPIPLEEIRDIDAVILSHDHYDHLDYNSIIMLKDHVGHFYTALGVGSHLKKWGVSSDKITELDWWESTELAGVKLTACPSRHFSGRGFNDRNATQWASWVIKADRYNLYFSGDSGYGPHFKEIGDRYGPFDFAMLECGQYNEAWEAIHMMPEQSVQAGIDLVAQLLMPIHWGAFKLSVHEWTDPIVRFVAESEKREVEIVCPGIGERFALGQHYPRNRWWRQVFE